MSNALHQKRTGFTLIEIMIVVTIISLLAGIAVPSFTRARKRVQATRVLEDLRIIEYSLDRWAIENGKAYGDAATLTDLQPYMRSGTGLYQGVDILGNSFGTSFSVDEMPKVPTATFNVLSDVAPSSFWSPYN